jgi:hypothetical protein
LREMAASHDEATYRRLMLALRLTPNGTTIPAYDFDSIEDELELDDLPFIALAIDFYGLDR